MKNNMAVMVIAIVVVAAGAFYAGMKYEKSKTTNSQTTGNTMMGSGNQGTGARMGNRGFGAGGTRPTVGEVVSSDANSVTVKMQDGSSKIILLSDKTKINKTDEGTTADLTAGTRVAVVGTANSDGSITAQSVQINPQLMAMGGGNGKQPNTAQKSPDAKEIVVTGSNYKFDPNTITVQKGQKTRIVFKNSGGFHDFVVDELGISTAVIQGGQEDFVEFTPEKTGTFEFYCSVGNHRQMGMVGKITVQ